MSRVMSDLGLVLLLFGALGCEALAERALERGADRRSEPPAPASPSARPITSRAGPKLDDAPPGPPSPSEFERVFAGSAVSVPPLLGDDAFDIPLPRLRARLGLREREAGGEAECGGLGAGEPVCIRYSLQRLLRPGATAAERDAQPVASVQFTINDANKLPDFVALVHDRWGPPAQTKSVEPYVTCVNNDCEKVTGYPLYHWFSDEVGLAMRAHGVGSSVVFVFYRYLPTAELPATFANAVRPYLGKPKPEGTPGFLRLEVRGHKWGRAGEPLVISAHTKSALFGPKIVRSFSWTIRYDARPEEMSVAEAAFRDRWGEPRLACAGRDPQKPALLFRSDPPIVAVRENEAWTLRAYDDEARAIRDVAMMGPCLDR